MIRAGHYVRLLKQPETRDRPGPGWNDAMEKLIGKWVEISSIGQHIRVRGTERTWSYSFDWDIEVSETLPQIIKEQQIIEKINYLDNKFKNRNTSK